MINFKNLHYLWAVARDGGVARASERLHLTPQTFSGQLSLLEEYLGVDLFSRVGRNLELTDAGRMVLSYADEIFSLGGELEEVIHQWCPGPAKVCFHACREIEWIVPVLVGIFTAQMLQV